MNSCNEYIKMYNLGFNICNRRDNINILLNKIKEFGYSEVPYLTNENKVKKLNK